MEGRRQHGSIAKQIRALVDGEWLFIPARDGAGLRSNQKTWRWNAQRILGDQYLIWSRLDRQRGGVWVRCERLSDVDLAAIRGAE